MPPAGNGIITYSTEGRQITTNNTLPYFENSLQHLLAELARLDLFLHVQVWRTRHLQPDDNDVLAYYIPDAEVDARLAQPPGRPLWANVTFPDDFNQDYQQAMDNMQNRLTAMTAASQAQGIPLRLELLAERFDLHPFERDAILICLAPELDLSYLRLYAYLQDDINQKIPTVDLILNLLCPDIEARVTGQALLSSTGTLFTQGLLHVTARSDGAAAPALAQPVMLSSRVRQFLLEDDTPDAALRPYTIPAVHPSPPFPSTLTPDVRLRLQTIATQKRPYLIYFQGHTGTGRRQQAAALAAHQNRPLLTAHCPSLRHAPPEQVRDIIGRFLREARLHNAILYWDSFDTLLTGENQAHHQTWLQLIAAYPLLMILSGEAHWEPQKYALPHPAIVIPFPLPETAERQHIWEEALNHQINQADLHAVATQFRFSPGQIHSAATTAKNLALWRNPNQPTLHISDIFKACRLHSNQNLNTLAQKIRPHYTWADIILPVEQLAQLQQLVNQVKNQARVFDDWGFGSKLSLARGINALFTGPPGTGKTMAADILAGQLELDLYKIDLSSVVSKYIGETEKNLARIFHEAETSNAVLFFDEADALFGKRTEVKDSHDRYANLEVSYLLQKMDEYEGVVILATNLRQNMDKAFVRRMQFIIEFSMPTASERRLIWNQIWPDSLPRDPHLDFDFLAEKIDVSGAHIRNIALTAAFLAAEASSPILTMDHILAAAKMEYKKMGKWVDENAL